MEPTPHPDPPVRCWSGNLIIDVQVQQYPAPVAHGRGLEALYCATIRTLEGQGVCRCRDIRVSPMDQRDGYDAPRAYRAAAGMAIVGASAGLHEPNDGTVEPYSRPDPLESRGLYPDQDDDGERVFSSPEERDAWRAKRDAQDV